MNKDILVVKGVFSELSIKLSDGIISNLAATEKENNPLAKAETKLKKALAQFEKDYTKAVRGQ